MTETSSILICPKLQQPRHHNFCCLHCAWLVKLAETWWCAWKAVDDD